MPWIIFSSDFDFEPQSRGGRVVIAFKAGMTQLVTQACAEKAIARGAAEPTQRPFDGKREFREIPKTDE